MNSLNFISASRSLEHLVRISSRAGPNLQLGPIRVHTIGDIETLAAEDLDGPDSTFATVGVSVEEWRASAGGEGLVCRPEDALLESNSRTVRVGSSCQTISGTDLWIIQSFNQ